MDNRAGIIRPHMLATAAFFWLGISVPATARTLAFDIDVGLGVALKPAWEGAGRHDVGAYPIFKLHALNLLGLINISGPEAGFSVSPSFGLTAERKASSDPILRGLGDVDRAFEVGPRLSYRWQHARAFLELRHGFGGHDGWVGQLGADVIWQAATNLSIEAGPRLGFADDAYMQTYFAITPQQAAASGYQTHAADAGIKNAGLKVEARYQLSNRWAMVGKLEYQRLIGDAGDSPIVTAGSPDQLTVGLGLTTRLQWSSQR